MLKIAKVKSEKEFYKKYPSEEAFMKAHGKAFKKAAMGSKMVNDQLHQLTDFGNPPKFQGGGAVNPNTGMFNMPMSGKSVSQVDTMAAGYGSTPPPEGFGNAAKGGGAAAAGMAALGALPGIIGGIEAIGSQKKAKKKAEQATKLSGLALQAQQTTQQPKNQYVRPEDNIVQPGQLGNPYGTGTNYLQAQNGKVIDSTGIYTKRMLSNMDMADRSSGELKNIFTKEWQKNATDLEKYKKKIGKQKGKSENGTMIGGNPTEIQNMYNPGDMYNDLGFEPLEETYKQYRRGGNVPKAEFGEYFQDSGQAQIGSAVGTAAGTALFGPLGGMVGGFLGKGVGNLLGGAKQARELQKEKDKTAMNTSQMGFIQNRSQGPLNANVKNGGWISHDWQPQVFAKFGEYDAKDLLKPPYDADMLRSGGHIAQVGYTAPSAEALYTGRPDMPNAQNGVQMALGGELQIGEGGYAETLSYNPNLPGGEIGMFRGASHDNGGIQTQYGDNGVEVEGGEPFTVLEDNGSEDGNNLEGGGSKENLVVFGNIKINKEIADLMGDPKAKGKKFKTYIADVAKNDAKQLKRIDKGLELIENANENSAYDYLTLNTGKAIMQGAKAWQKINADKIKEAGIVQDSIHKTANELGVKSDKLAEGKLEKETDPSMIGKNGKKMKKAQGGITSDQYGNYFLGAGNLIDQSGDLPGAVEVAGVEGGGGKFGNILNTLGKGIEKYGPTILSNIAPFLRPSNANEDLPPDQLYPEYLALATNQLEPVQAQKFQPMLDTPYDISFNDQLNAIDSQSRAAIRAAGQNPAAQSMIMAQTLQAKNQVLAEQNRANQANKMGVYDKNRATLNDAQLKNLAILDQQYVRQAQAKSNTKAQTQAAISSIAAKTAQQRASNRKLAIMENMYGFRFSPSGRAINMNAPAQFDTSGMNARRSGLSSAGLPANKRFTIDSVTGEPVGIRTLTKNEMAAGGPSMSELDSAFDNQKRGGKTPKTKARNSSIVKALKSL